MEPVNSSPPNASLFHPAVEPLKRVNAVLPCISEALDGIGGQLKSEPEFFQVEEILPYAPCGEGEHVFVVLRRKNLNTMDVARQIQRVLGVNATDVGYGGRKDKWAVTTQTFSIRISLSVPLSDIQNALSDLPVEILELKRHGNKLKIGHVSANRFRIIITDCVPDALERANTVAQRLKENGIPNFFGEQRFGEAYRNLDRGLALFSTRKKSRRRSDVFLVSAVQAALFNAWLAQRMGRGEFSEMLPGDVAKKTDTGGLFTVSDVEEARSRLHQGAIVYTGPIFGYKMMSAGETAGGIETGLLASFGMTPLDFKPLRAKGTRRPAILHIPDLAIETVGQGLRFSFTLPSGAYATTVLREFMKTKVPSPITDSP
ncbi:MAG: tRNA pseudouridine(13) synthase TruD [Desulfobacteraceae bacterium]|nr:tRNA pseudouridine(13) synthase TruD [Desulfobacteraceae bacterium]